LEENSTSLDTGDCALQGIRRYDAVFEGDYRDILNNVNSFSNTNSHYWYKASFFLPDSHQREG
jgi:hypothetical protein